MKGLFITFEGNDGCGKSTVVKHITKYLKDLGYDVVTTREPGGSPIAEEIRKVILDPKNKDMDPQTEALLYAASRREHTKKTIIPAIQSGKIVISDRYIDSSYAYQAGARELGFEYINDINRFVYNEGLVPDLSFLIYVNPTIGMERINNNRSEKDRLELETMEFHQKAAQTFIEIAENDPRFCIIDGTMTPQEVCDAVEYKIHRFLTLNHLLNLTESDERN